MQFQGLQVGTTRQARFVKDDDLVKDDDDDDDNDNDEDDDDNDQDDGDGDRDDPALVTGPVTKLTGSRS